MNRSLPTITILTTTYFPPDERGMLRETGFRESLGTWETNLHYAGELQLLVVHDGPALRPYPEWTKASSYMGQSRGGLGKSYNNALPIAFAFSPLVLNLCDDRYLVEPYDLTPWAEMLLDDEQIGAVHLSDPYPGCTGTIEPRQHGWVVRLNRHNLAAGLRACLYHRRFFTAYGWFDTGLSAHETERLFNERFCQAQGPESVLALPIPWRDGLGASVVMGQESPKGERVGITT